VHHSRWPVSNPAWADPNAEMVGELLVEAATAVRRYKSEKNLSLGTELSAVKLAISTDGLVSVENGSLQENLLQATADLMSITRAQHIEIVDMLPANSVNVNMGGRLNIALDLCNG
jgi:valyl-tRNA synthetase